MQPQTEIYRLNDPILLDALDRVTIKLLQYREQNGMQAIMLCGCEPQVGTTTLAINIAVAMASSSWKTVLVDADMRKDNQFKHLGRGCGLSDYLAGESAAPDILYSTNHENLSYIPCGISRAPAAGGSPVRLLSSSLLPQLIDALKQAFTFVIIDAPSTATAADAEIIMRRADAGLLVARWDHTDTRQVREARDVLQATDGNLLGIMVNQMNLKEFAKFNKDHSYFIDKKYISKRMRKKVHKGDTSDS